VCVAERAAGDENPDRHRKAPESTVIARLPALTIDVVRQ
jgi:hypothetical protein